MSSGGMIQYLKARERMIREQLLPRGITDPLVLKAMQEVPRHIFVEDALQAQAYGDFPLPIGEGQTISQPYIVALMTEMLELQGEEKVLEIGTGCGYQTAVLAKICERVYSVERIKKLLARARINLDSARCFNTLCKMADGTMGWPEHGPYDAIIVTAGGPEVPTALLEQLAEPGIMVIPVGDRSGQQLIRVVKTNGTVNYQKRESVRFVSLIGAQGWKIEQ
ncbi:MAG: protein-L-isoaspartate(D-aspartate) O-methyltransferase [Desulfurivibrionaceae bacterium]|nr:protein-L-isoaspartate(D-aspartate) O-methyltransferase [Desulfobulbales bacterium]MDT8335383.1 protein-L-isoaspartate(D-aspartate) O-methyltransferase [Desulfurivibrionaceae bacterium]